MNNYVIIPDTSCDLTADLRARFDIPDYLRGVITYPDGHSEHINLDWENITPKEFYESMKDKKSLYKTSAVNPDEALEVFKAYPRIVAKLKTLSDVGLGYIKLGQPANTLSGGEAQRIKLSLELSRRTNGRALYILDEPTTGLHWDDIDKLLKLLFKLRDAGNTIIVIEHHPDFVKLADWLVELGPTGGANGGNIIFEGNYNDLKSAKTPTAKFIK